MGKLNHTKAFTKVLKAISSISPQILIVKEGGEINVRQMSDTETLMIHVNAPHSSFEFAGEHNMVGFKDYPSFNAILDAITDASIDEVQDGTILSVSNKYQKFTYRMSAPSRIMGRWSSVEEPEWDCVVDVPVSIINEFCKAISLVGAERVRVSVTPNAPDQLVFTAIPPTGENNWEYTFHLEAPLHTMFSYSLNINAFTAIPKLDYKLHVSYDEMMKFTTDVEEVAITIFALSITEKKGDE